MKLERPIISQFQLNKKKKNDFTLQVTNNFQIYNSVLGVIYVVDIISLTVLMEILSPGAKGYVITLAIAYVTHLIASINFIKKATTAIFSKTQKKMITFIAQHRKVFKYFFPSNSETTTLTISSAEELKDIIENDGSFLTAEQKKIIVGGLNFYDTPVTKYMIKKSDIHTVKGSEILGPVVLDRLYQANQEYVLVIGKNIDEVKGVLSMQDQLVVDSDAEKTQTAIKAAKKPPHYIAEDLTIGNALDMMLNERTDVLVVIDKKQNTVGLLTLKAVLDSLVG